VRTGNLGLPPSPFTPFLFVISSPPPVLSSFFHLALELFFSTLPSVSWSLVGEILVVGN
jgi:hypothetical protein